MKTSWQTKKLSEVTTLFTDGDWIEKKDQSHDGIRLIQTGNVGSACFKDRIDKARYISEKTFRKLNCTEIVSGDCLVSRLPDPVGRACLIPDTCERMITAVDCTIIRFKEVVIPQWFVNYTLSLDYQHQINKEVGGATRQRISRANLGNVEIPVPSISEQKRIVKILGESFEKITKAKENVEKNLQNAKELFESTLHCLFNIPATGWKVGKIEDFVHFIDYRGKTPKKTEAGIRLITAKNIKMGYIKRDPEEFIDPDNYESWMTRGIPQKGDVLFTTEAPLAMVAQLDTDEKVAFAQRTIIFQTDSKKLDSTFFKYLLMSKPIQNKIIEKGTGATVQGIKASLLKKIEIYFPESTNEQKTIVSKLNSLSDQTKKLEANYKRKIADLDELKKSLLTKAFAGEL